MPSLLVKSCIIYIHIYEYIYAMGRLYNYLKLCRMLEWTQTWGGFSVVYAIVAIH